MTTGPWEEIGPLPLLDISIQVDLVGSEESPVAVWAIGTNGDVLCRSGVTKGWVTSVCRVALGSQCLGKYNPKGEANFLGLFLSKASLSLAERGESIGRIKIALLI